MLVIGEIKTDVRIKCTCAAPGGYPPFALPKSRL